MIVTRPRIDRSFLPPPFPGIARVDSINILGVNINHNLSMSDHISKLESISGQTLYALKTLKAHGLPLSSVSDTCRATLISRLLYASPAWRGFATLTELQRLQNIINKAVRWGVCIKPDLLLSELLDDADDNLFEKILNNSFHILHPLLPPKKETTYHLRQRIHDRTLSVPANISKKNFICRMLFKSCY